MVLSLMLREMNKKWFKSLTLIYTMHIIPIPYIKLWGSDYITWSKCSHWGFNIMENRKGGNNIGLFTNYRDVGFGLILDTKLSPLMHLGVWGSPILGLGSMKDLVILLGLLFV